MPSLEECLTEAAAMRDELDQLGRRNLVALEKNSDVRFRNAMDALQITMRIELETLGAVGRGLLEEKKPDTSFNANDLLKVKHAIALIVTMRGEASLEAARNGTMLDDPSFECLEWFLEARKTAGSIRQQLICRASLFNCLARKVIPVIQQRIAASPGG
jgi:hypothetical protein